MNRWILLAAALACLPTTVDAGVISRDWKTPGDGLLTYDDINQREWLDLSQTILSSQFPGADREAKYQFVVAQTSLGGLFDGFTVAQPAEVIAFGQSAGIITDSLSWPINSANTESLIELVEPTHDLAVPLSRFAVGLVDATSSIRLGARFYLFPGGRGAGEAGLSIDAFYPELHTPPAVFLTRTAVPEPAGIALALLAFVALIGRIMFAPPVRERI